MKLFIWHYRDALYEKNDCIVFAIAKNVCEAREIVRASESFDKKLIECTDEEPEVHCGNYGYFSCGGAH